MAFTQAEPTSKRAATHAKPTSQMVAQWRQSQRLVKRRKPKSIKRRHRLETDKEAWLKYYFPHAYKLNFGEPHHELIDRADYAVTTGGSFAMAGPRGLGKSVLFWGLCMYYVLTARVHFPGYLPWNAVAQKRGLRFWKNALCHNRRLAADYPEYCDPFIASGGSAQRCLALVWDDGTPTGAKIKISDGMIILPDSRGCLGSATINGNPRGLNLPTESGEVLRPDLLFLDDVQDKETARSPKLITDTIDVIDTDVMGMAGPDTTLPALMACTVLRTDDVSSHYLGDDAPDWDGYIVPQISAWPKGWDDDKSTTRDLWTEWNRIRLDGAAKRDRGKADRAFYRANRKAMTSGMRVTWKERYDRKRRQPDALYAAMVDYFRMGHNSFMAERQNAPVSVDVSIYDLSPDLIVSRTEKGRRPLQVPDYGKIIVVATDINHYGLHSAMIAFGNDQTAAVLWYGVFTGDRGKPIVPKNAPEAVRNNLIYEALVSHGKQISNAVPMQSKTKMPVTVWLIDGGYSHKIVQRYVKSVGHTMAAQVHVARGYPADRYRPTGKNVIGKPREQCHMTKWPMGRGLAYNQHYWCEIAQRAWLGSVGSPGSISLFQGSTHGDFASQICRDKLVEKFDGKSGTIWHYDTAPGRHDYGDAVYMCYVGAAWNGIGTQLDSHTTQKKTAKVIRWTPNRR